MQPTNDNSILKTKALILRQKGYLQSEIAKELGIPRSTLHGWLREQILTSKQQAVIRERLTYSKLARMASLQDARQKHKRAREQLVAETAEAIVASAELTTPQKQIICAIFFWCEGGKDTRAGWQFINSDPVMVQTFLALLRDSFDVDEAKFRCLLHLHDYHDVEQQHIFWSKVTGVPRDQFHKPYLKPHTGKQKKEGYPGCVSIRYLDRQFGLLLQMLYTSFGNTYRGVR